MHHLCSRRCPAGDVVFDAKAAKQRTSQLSVQVAGITVEDMAQVGWLGLPVGGAWLWWLVVCDGAGITDSCAACCSLLPLSQCWACQCWPAGSEQQGKPGSRVQA
jgi:hypothetical protein